MKITKIDVENFRLLKKFSIDLEDDLSLILGKNNTGKTSLLAVMDKFLNNRLITYDDFNNDIKTLLLEQVCERDEILEENYKPISIKLIIYIAYELDDNLEVISSVILDLDPEKNSVVLELSYELEYEKYLMLRHDLKRNTIVDKEDIKHFIRNNISHYIGSIKHKSLSLDDPELVIDLNKNRINISNIISFKSISAKRDVTNSDNNRTLSAQTANIYKNMTDGNKENECLENLQRSLRNTDKELTNIYYEIFKDVIKSVDKFGGIKPAQTQISISSTLEYKQLLEGNTTVFYNYNNHKLPEHYNGLGYMNLISMIFEIEVLLNDFKKSEGETPAALNILFIEEPEAHTHPQMQYVFIKNIKNFIKEQTIIDSSKILNLQTLISTHSSHIIVESDFNSIKYLKLKSQESNCVEAKNLRDLKDEYAENNEEQHYKFLKQYLTLNCAELFFADKIILIERDTERILLPAMMRKIDQADTGFKEIPLLSQNISIIAVGAHSQIFDKLIAFLGVKCLIITDIDSVELKSDTDKNGRKYTFSMQCKVESPEANSTSNNSLKYYYKGELDKLGKCDNYLNYFRLLSFEKRVLSKSNGIWEINSNGNLYIAYQTKENDYHGRSFEDSFFSVNHDIIGLLFEDDFPSLKLNATKDYIDNGKIDPYVFANNAINSKPKLAIEILLNSKHDEETGNQFINWEIPQYIKEGLLWIQKD